MSRYPPADYRGTRDRSRSPPRFSDRRPSAASIFDSRESRPAGPARTASDAPRASRPQFDGPRPSLLGGLGTGIGSRPAYSSLRDAPPLSNIERGRQSRERDYERRDRPASPRERSPLRNFKDPRDFPLRDLDVGRARRETREGPPSAGSSNYSDSQPFASSAPTRGGFTRGRGRGDFSFRGGRGGRSNLDDRELFRRSPPPRFEREFSRERREPDRRPDDRRFERREDDRRAADWTDRERERERELDRPRREQLPPRLESRPSSESTSGANASYLSSQAPFVNPARLPLIEGVSADSPSRRSSTQQESFPPRDARRDQPETPAYLNGRAETTANRYGSRGSSSPTQAPPVPAFTLSFAQSAGPSTQPIERRTSLQALKTPLEDALTPALLSSAAQDAPKSAEEQKLEHPAEAPTAPRAPPSGPKAQLANPPPTAPRGPRALENEDNTAPSSRLQGVRSSENLSTANAPMSHGFPRPDPSAIPTRTLSTSLSPAGAPAVPNLVQSVSPGDSQASRLSDLGAPTGPRATRTSPALVSVSPRPPFASPRSDMGSYQGPPGLTRVQTPPPSAPSGPRNQSFSVSPKVASSAAPTAPKADRAPPLAPRGADRAPVVPTRPPERLGAAPPWAPPTAPRGLQWNQWRRQGVSGFGGDKIVPAKRDFSGEEKTRFSEQGPSFAPITANLTSVDKSEERIRMMSDAPSVRTGQRAGNEMELNRQPPKRQNSQVSGPAHQSFFGKPAEEEDEDTEMSEAGQELSSASEDDDSDLDHDLALFNAKFERQKRQLEAQLVDLSTRHYRVTTPLESIARLARISPRDLQRIAEQREHEIDVDGPSVVHHQHLHPPTTHSSDSGDGPGLLTPKGEDDHGVSIRGSDDSSDSLRRVRRPSPEPINLPYLLKNAQPPLIETPGFKESLRHHEHAEHDILDAMEDDMLVEEDGDDEIDAAFADAFRKWREECEDLDRLKEELEKLERQQSLEPGPEIDAPTLAPTNPIIEGRRLHKFSSEYEIEQVLKQSEETARIEQERQEREAKKNQADMEKEAFVPDKMRHEEIARSIFIDYNRYRDTESLTMVFSYEPPADTFTENEQQIFIGAFRETPKKWGEIASLLPGRTYEDCIRHYYTNKWDGRFLDTKAKKFKAGGRRGRGGARGPRGRVGGLMADLAGADDFLSAENMSEKGRPRRAAAPTTFADKEAEAKAGLLGPSPAKKPGPGGSKTDSNGDTGSEKPGKKQKKGAEKPGRKAKGGLPLAAIAAAPQASPGKQFMHRMQSKEDLARAQKLEDANLLASFQSGHQGVMNADGQMIYPHEGFMQGVSTSEEPERLKPPGQQGPPQKQGASSYWSVPEQNDFVKYIGYFGRDFAAIAAHMGTKTQTMIKNHYQRQIDGGSRADLERSANEADERWARGEDMGPPPTPTPIQKRKYENPQAPAQRAIAPHAEAMEVDDGLQSTRPQPLKHTSPPQYQTQPRFSSSAHSTPASASRVAPSPLPANATSAVSQLPPPSHGRPMQHPIGSRITFLPDSHPEPRLTAGGFRATQDSPPRTQPSRPNQTISDPPDQQYIRELMLEQGRAHRLQEQDRMEQHQRQTPLHRNPLQSSVLNQSVQNPLDRKPISEELPPSPLRSTFSTSTFPRPLLNSSTLRSGGPTSFTSLGGRSSLNPSPPKREEARPPSIPMAPSAQPALSAPPEPKRSNVFNVLNSEPEEPKVVKRESFTSTGQSANSPAQHDMPQTTTSTPLSGISAMAREFSSGPPSLPQFQRGPFGQQSLNATPALPKHEPSPGNGSHSVSSKLDFISRVYQSQPTSSAPTLERDVRPYFHRSVLGSLVQQRGNPSPPPLSAIPHSRTPSLTGATNRQSREPSRGSAPGQQQQGPHQPAHPLAPHPYAGQQAPTFSQQQSGQTQSHSNHARNISFNSPFPALHHRTISRDDHVRQEQAMAPQRIIDEHDMRWRPMEERRREDQTWAQREQEQEREREREHERERERQQPLHRMPPSSLQPPVFGGSFGPSRPLDVRGQSSLDLEMAIHEQEERQRLQHDKKQQELRDREAEELRRRQGEPFFHRGTPLGGGFGAQPPPRR